MSKVLVVGLGYVGLSSAIGLATLNHEVMGLDTDESKVDQLRSGLIPIFEPGFEDNLLEQIATGNLTFSSKYADIDPTTEFAFVCVATPSGLDGNADLSFVQSAIASLTSALLPGATIVIKSTVPIGTCESFVQDLQKSGINLVSNPEFLAEGTALRDFLQPNRIVIGANSTSESSSLDALFKSIKSPRVYCSLTSAETIKHASNSLLAVKLSFVNELAQLCEKTGANISEVAVGMSLDPRIGAGFLSPGPGWGGSCFPKDTLELNLTANKYGVQMHTVASAILSNQFATQRVIDRVISIFGGSVKGRRIAVWGLTFKANTDDTRESPALKIVVDLAKRGGIIAVYDPQARCDLPDNVVRAPSPLDACLHAEALLVLTEWEEFKGIDAAEVKESMADYPWILDLRRLLPATSWRSHFKNFELIGE